MQRFGSSLVAALVVLVGVQCSAFSTEDAPPPDSEAPGDGGVDGRSIVTGEPGTPGDASLSNLTLSLVPISPDFTSQTLVYTAGPISISELFQPTTTVTAATSQVGAKLVINGVEAKSGEPSRPIPIKVGPNPIDVQVTSSDGRKVVHYSVVVSAVGLQQPSDFIKPSNTRSNLSFGYAVAVSGDTMAVGAPGENSGATGVNGNQGDTSAADSGAVYVYQRAGGKWGQIAYLKASNSRADAAFGKSVALSGDALIVGAPDEKSAATGVGGNQSDTSATGSGAAYVFRRAGGTWMQEAYLKASNTRIAAVFGTSVAIDGDTAAVGAVSESSNATGVNGNQADSSLNGAGAVYVFVRSGGAWSQQAYVKASNTRGAALGPRFGISVSISGDRLAVGSDGETSGATGINGDATDTSADHAGAVYVFKRTASTWAQEAYIKASNARAQMYFGTSISLRDDKLAVGAPFESSSSTGVGGNQSDTSASQSGAVYMFSVAAGKWTQEAYVKATNTRKGARFGWSVALAEASLAVGSPAESSNATGVNGDPSNSSLAGAGAVYLYRRSSGGTWTAATYAKAATVGAAQFGWSLGFTNDTMVAGAPVDTSNAKGVNGTSTDTLLFAGAAYAFR
jgi:trimeric autotransporter adhesin